MSTTEFAVLPPACKQCGLPVKIAATGEDYRGSGWLKNADPEHHFCTVRCAASYGIKAAK